LFRYIPGCLSGSTEVGRAVFPAHLEGAGDHQLDWFIIRLAWQDIAEVELFFLRYNEPPEAILDVKFDEHPGAFLFITGGQGMD